MTTRTFQVEADFESDAHHVLGTSTTRRPDAVTLDYLTAWSMGPVLVGDPSQGYEAYRWYVRMDGHDVYLARSNPANTKWEKETLLFSYEGALATEIGLAFERSGWPVIALERPTGPAGAADVWLFWRDPLYA